VIRVPERSTSRASRKPSNIEVGLASLRARTTAANAPNDASCRKFDGTNRWKLLEVAGHLGSPKLAADNYHLVLVNTVKIAMAAGFVDIGRQLGDAIVELDELRARATLRGGCEERGL
jgi:hypothetical protein